MAPQSKIMEFKKSIFKANAFAKPGVIATTSNIPVSPSIFQSWQRSFDNGIYVEDFIDDSFFETDQLTDILDANRAIIDLSSPEINRLYQLIKGAGNMILLADKNGVILEQMGDEGFVARAEQVLITLGAKWGEADKGTNGIGTAIAENRSVSIRGSEHYLNSNSGFSCSAVPIHDPFGDILGVLTITADHEHNIGHTLALIKMSVEHIENELFSHNFHQDIIVELCTNGRKPGWLGKIILVFDFYGVLIAANKNAMEQFGLSKLSLNKRLFTDLFDSEITPLVDHMLFANHRHFELSDHRGGRYFAKAKTSFARLQGVSQAAEQPNPLPSTPLSLVKTNISFDDINLGDTVISGYIEKIKKIISHDVPILLQGEIGTGKEWMARAIHNHSQRAAMPFVAINCATIAPQQVETELFGRAVAGFIGAKTIDYNGKLVAANGGYLFLNEIDALPMVLQTRLLRALEEKQVCPVGGSEYKTIDIRLIASSDQDLTQMVEAGKFRSDLYYRLNGLAITLPNLCERDDFVAVVKAILKREFPDQQISISDAVWQVFNHHRWQGNIRQLYQILKVSSLICDDDKILLKDLPPEFWHKDSDGDTKSNAESGQNNLLMSFDAGEKIVLQNMLKNCGHNISKAARELRISRNTLYSKLKRFNIT
ncbi:MAG: sigma-54-dependent Fis family transcriptional regulator [Rhizobiales bacterium]|nr:sigma-54-dependent Fis family transcriptional regulator [Hyphomicrobiales bacterium]NRB15366.1 sigma-54-dependent Fis family transcriptional regulator [Hyphomicrobiales bacterium]